MDTGSHAETCKMGGRTMAVLGSGLDVVYPPENKKLVEMICEKGAVVTELAFGAKPDAMNFPRRNRIISGLTCGTVVTEAGLKSGALITAYQALEQNREVFAVPGSIFSQQHAGSNKLIREGAKLVATVEDVLEELPAQGELFGKMDNGISTIKLSKDERSIVDVLRNGELHVDKISEILHTQTANVLSTLLKLELAGIVQQQPGKNFVLKKRI
ncbi:MAG: DNA-processing protein DprA [Calditrichaeota bacterium]|nr:MAG: DNA-processing protein DprA [Calditrichota bacterium]